MKGVEAVAIVGIRLWAAVTIFESLSSLTLEAIFFVQGHKNAREDFSLIVATAGIAWLVAGFGAWIFAGWLARRLVPSQADQSLSISMGAQEFIQIGGFLIGVFYLVEVIPWVFTYSARLVEQFRANADRSPPFYSHVDYVWLGASFIKIMIALWLMVGSRKLARIFSSMRTAGLHPVD